jgi:cytochrome c553
MTRSNQKTLGASVAISTMVVAATMFASVAQAKGNVEAGKELATKKYACVSCHGGDFATPIDPSYPKLAGQHEDYLRQALISYQKGNHPMYGRGSAVMSAQAKPLSTKEIEDIAAYLASLPPSVVLRR